MSQYSNRAHVQQKDPLLAQALDSIVAQIQSIATQTVATINGVTPAPPIITALSVLASSGIFDIQIQDNAPVHRGINYFVEYSTTPNFVQPHVIDLGASRSYRATWGNQTLYFRAYSQYSTSPPSPTVYFGSEAVPTAVVGGGSAGPTPQASTGSGTAPNTGLQGGAGYGHIIVRPRGQNVV
jgi:hypothetical protein